MLNILFGIIAALFCLSSLRGAADKAFNKDIEGMRHEDLTMVLWFIAMVICFRG